MGIVPGKVPFSRVDRLLSNRGVGSRREVLHLIRKKKVKLNGSPILSAADKVPLDAIVEVDGTPTHPIPLMMVYHKPTNVLNEFGKDRLGSGRLTLSDTLPEYVQRSLHPVGRLDYETNGLLLLSREGVLTQRLLHPKRLVEREYVARVEMDLDPLLVQRLETGVQTTEGIFRAKIVNFRNDTMQLIVTEGKHRMVRRMLANAGYPVTSLTRIRFGGIQLGDMAPGELRALEPDELAWAENLMESTYNQQMVISRNQTLPATKEERRAARPKTESEKTAKDLFEFLRQEEENRPDDEELKKRMTPEQFAEHLRMRKAIEKFNDPETDIENDWDFEFSREQKRAMERFDEEMDADSSAVSSGSLGAPGLGVQGGVHRGSDSDLTETFPWLEDLAMSKEEIFREGGGKGAEEEGGQEEENRWEVMRREQQLRDRIFGRGGGGLGVNEEEDALLSEEEEETEGVDLLRQRERSRG